VASERVKPKDVTSGNVLRNVLYMGVPSMAGFAATSVSVLIEIFWVGLIGTPAVAAVTLFQAFAFVLVSTNMLVGAGSVALISRRFGEGDLAATESAIKQTLLLKLFMALAIGGAGFWAIGRVLSLLHAQGEVMRLGVEYGRFFLLALPFIFCSFTMFTAFRAIGDSTKAMVLMLVTAVANIVLDPVMMFDRAPITIGGWGLVLVGKGAPIGLGLGLKGAAIARAVSTFLAVAIGLAMLRYNARRLSFRVTKGWRPDLGVMLRIIRIGLPPGLENIGRTLAGAVTTSFVGLFGTVVVAGFGFALRVLGLTMVFAVGMSLGTAAIVGQCLGASKPEIASEAVKKGAVISLGIAGALCGAIWLWAAEIMQLLSRDPMVIVKGVLALKIIALSQVMLSVRGVVSSAFTGSGNTWPPTVIGLVSEGCRVGLIAALLYLFHTTEIGIWWAFVAAAGADLAVVVVWFRKGRWKRRTV